MEGFWSLLRVFSGCWLAYVDGLGFAPAFTWQPQRR